MSWPVFTSLRGYDRGWLRGDVIAGLTVWAVLVPEALAYATIAGVSPVVGLYAAPEALLLYAAFGSSRHLPDFLAAVAALLGVLVFDTLPGLFIGVLVSLLLLYRASRPHVAVLGQVPGAAVGQYGDVRRHPENRQLPGIVILRLESGLFFANADAVRDAVRGHAVGDGIRAVVLDAETIPYIDVTAARMLAQLDDELDRRGVRLVVARDIGQVRDVLRRTEEDGPLLTAYPTVQEAVDALGQAAAGG